MRSCSRTGCGRGLPIESLGDIAIKIISPDSPGSFGMAGVCWAMYAEAANTVAALIREQS